MGRAWMIPKCVSLIQEHLEVDPAFLQLSFRIPLPLLNSTYPVGQCREFIDTITDPDDRRIALGEYYYYTGQPKLAADTVWEYLNSTDSSLRYSAEMICLFANLAQGQVKDARFALGRLQEQLNQGLRSDSPPQVHAIGIFTALTVSSQLRVPVQETPPLEEFIRYLPSGLKLWSCYLLAHDAYLKKNYEKCLTIVDTAIILSPNAYPVAEVHCHLVAVMALMAMRRVEEARKRIHKAWMLAKEDNLIELFAEHHGMLHGMIEMYFKKDYPKDFRKLVGLGLNFTKSIFRLRNTEKDHALADHLTMLELSVAVLYGRGWHAKTIAEYLELSEKTVRNYINAIYSKLGITDRKALREFMMY